MFIDGFIISGYRSFGKTPQRIGPLGKINLMVGQNNSDKSRMYPVIFRLGSFALNIDRALREMEECQRTGLTVEYRMEGPVQLSDDPRLRTVECECGCDIVLADCSCEVANNRENQHPFLRHQQYYR